MPRKNSQCVIPKGGVCPRNLLFLECCEEKQIPCFARDNKMHFFRSLCSLSDSCMQSWRAEEKLKPALLLQKIQCSRPGELGGIGVILRARSVKATIHLRVDNVSELFPGFCHCLLRQERIASGAEIELRVLRQNWRVDRVETLRRRAPAVDDSAI